MNNYEKRNNFMTVDFTLPSWLDAVTELVRWHPGYGMEV